MEGENTCNNVYRFRGSLRSVTIVLGLLIIAFLVFVRSNERQLEAEVERIFPDSLDVFLSENEAITELHNLLRKNHEHLDVFLHREINRYASKEMLGHMLADIQEEIHKHKR